MKRFTTVRPFFPPHVFAPSSQSRMTYAAIIALLPAAAWGIGVFGLSALFTVCLAAATALIAEGVAQAILKRPLPLDGSALLTGLIIGLSLPPTAPVAVPVAASLFAILAVKLPAGGLGSNWMNPAMAGTAFSYASFKTALSSFALPSTVRGADALTGATPLQYLWAGVPGAQSYAGTGFDSGATNLLNEIFFRPLGASLPGGYMDMLFGNRPGAIGEIAIGFLILGSIGLLAAGVIRWEIPVAALGALAALSWIFGGLMGAKGLFSGDALLSLLCGSAFMASFFCATDPVTSPSRTGPRIAYGALVGALIFLFRTAKTGGDATAFAVISANVAVPLLERATGSRRARRRG